MGGGARRNPLQRPYNCRNITRNADAEWLILAAAQIDESAPALRALRGCGQRSDRLHLIRPRSIRLRKPGTNRAGERTNVGSSLTGNGFAAIADTDVGVLDGYDRWDGAVGHMQFVPEKRIPSTSTMPPSAPVTDKPRVLRLGLSLGPALLFLQMGGSGSTPYLPSLRWSRL